MNISKRLLEIGDLLHFDSVVDIGSDHGLLPIYLLKKGKIKKALCTDLSESSVQKIQQNIQKYLSPDHNAKTLLTDGLDGVKSGEYAALIIAGMGGRLIIKILEQNLQTARSFEQIILSPQNNAEELRRFLHKSGFFIETERMIIDKEKFYNIINLEVGEQKYNKYEYAFGKFLLEQKNPVLKKFIQNEIKKSSEIKQLIDYKIFCEEVYNEYFG